MSTYSKTLLSASSNGKQIVVTGTGTATMNTIHTATSTAGAYDEIWLYAASQATAADVTFCWGGTVYPDDYVTATVPIRTGRTLVVDGKLLGGGLAVTAFTTTGTIEVDGFVNRIVP
jgi:hypothetical protein